MVDEWASFRARRAEYAATASEFAKKMYGPRFDEGAFTLQNVVVEQTIDVKEEPYNK